MPLMEDNAVFLPCARRARVDSRRALECRRMRPTFPKILVFVVLVGFTPLFAADLSGKWVGIMTSGSRGGSSTATLFLRLQREADTLAGTVAYQDETKQVAIEKPQLRGDQLTFEVHDNPARIIKFRLTVAEGTLEGEGASGDRVVKIKLNRR